HCARCGYDYWLVAGCNPKWDSYLAICGWGGAIYKRGPKTVLHLLTEEQKSEIITRDKRKAFFMLRGGMINALPEKPKRLLRGRDTRRKRQCSKGRVRPANRRALRHRH